MGIWDMAHARLRSSLDKASVNIACRPISISNYCHRRYLRAALSVLALAALAGAGVLGVGETLPASAQSLSESASEACEAVDLLLLMDQSGSLESVDPGGEKRSQALNSIRSDFSGDDRWHVALIGFNTVPLLHSAWFRPAADTGQRHPSDDEIAEALPGRDSTYYGVALDAGLQVFADRARGESCRHLVWFTDGLHDTAPGSTAEEVQEAEDLRETVCRVTAPMYNAEGVSTSVVLLGDSFEGKLQSSDRHERRMAELSLDIIGIMTGERVIAGRPVDADCPTADLPNGDVYQVEDVADLINSIVEATLPARGLLRWSDCDTSEGDMRKSDALPAGAYIDEIQVLSYRGAIDRYRLGPGEWTEASAGSRRIGLNPDALEDLAAGWELVIEVVADGGRDIGEVSLSCWSKPVDTPLMMTGTTTDGSGNVATVLLQDRPYILGVDMEPFDCPVEAFDLESEALASPMRYADCGLGSDARFEFEAVRAGEATQMTAALGHLTPEHAGVLWGDRGPLAVEVDVTTRPHILSDEPVVCSQPGDLPRVEGGLLGGVPPSRARIVVGECGVARPDEGTLTVDVEDVTEGPDYHMENLDGERIEGPLTLSSGDEPRQIRIVSDEMAPERLPQQPGEVKVTAEWQPSEDVPPQPAAQETMEVPPAAQSPLDCKGVVPNGAAVGRPGAAVGGPGVGASDGPQGRIVASDCVVMPPADGTFTVDVDGPDYHMENADGERIEGPLTLSSGDEPRQIRIVGEWVSFTEMPPAAGEVAVIVEWQPAEGAPLLPVWQRVIIPQLGDVRLTCGLEDDLPRIEAAAPLRVAAAACEIEPPREGTLTVEASVAADSPAYYVEAPDGARFEDATIGSGDSPLRLRVVSESLGPDGWSTEGALALTVALAPGGGPALVAVHFVAVPELPLPSPLLECESAPMQLMNADGDEVPSEPLEATLRCWSTWRGLDGQLTLTLAAGTGLLAPDWRFLPASALLNDGRGLRFEDGEELTEVRFVTSGALPNDRIEDDGTVVIEAQWMVPGWREPLTGVTEVRYSVDLWPRSILWLAVLITLAAAMLSWLLLYGVVAFKNRLPTAGNFYARRFEISTYRDSRGGLRSAEIESFNLDDHAPILVSGDSRQKRLRTEELRITAKHPKWWQITSLLRGGWGEVSAGPNRIVAVQPKDPRERAGLTPEQFTELAVIALDSRSGSEEPRGIAYVLVPRAPSERPDVRQMLDHALRDLSGTRGAGTGAELKPPRSERPR